MISCDAGRGTIERAARRARSAARVGAESCGHLKPFLPWPRMQTVTRMQSSGRARCRALLVSAVLGALCFGLPGCERREAQDESVHAQTLSALPVLSADRLGLMDAAVAALVRERAALAEARPNDPGVLANFAYALHANGSDADALKVYQRLEAIEVREGRWSLMAARALRSLGRMDEAVASMERAADLGFAGGLPHAYLGFWLLERGDVEASRAAFDQAMRSPQPVINATIGRAQVAIAEGNTQEAMRLLGIARSAAPNERYARYLLGLCLREIGDIDGARIELAVGAGSQVNWSQQDPTLSVVHGHWVGYRRDYNFGSSLLGAGQLDRAATVFEDLHRRHPDDVPVMTALGSVMINQGRSDEAIELLVGGIARAGDHYAIHQTLGLAFERSGHLERALEHSGRAADLHPGMVQTQTQHARQLAAAGRAEEAEVVYRKAIQTNPAHSAASLALAEFLLGHGRREEAVQTLTTSAQLNPGDAEPVVALAHLALEGGQRDRTRQLLELALRINPEHAAARQMLSRLR